MVIKPKTKVLVSVNLRNAKHAASASVKYILATILYISTVGGQRIQDGY